MDDRLHLLGVEVGAGPGLDEDRRGGRLLLVGEQLVLREREVHDRGLDGVERLDGGLELPLHGPLVAGLLLELGGGEVLLVEDRVAARALAGEALAAEPDPGVVHVGAGHEDRRAAVAELVRRAVGLELLDDRGGVRRRDVGEQRGVRRGGGPPEQEDRAQDEGEAADDRDGLLAGGEGREDPLERLEASGQLLAHQIDIRMISWNASRALLRTAVVSWVVTAASVAVIV